MSGNRFITAEAFADYLLAALENGVEATHGDKSREEKRLSKAKLLWHMWGSWGRFDNAPMPDSFAEGITYDEAAIRARLKDVAPGVADSGAV